MEPSETTKMRNSLPSFVRAAMLFTLYGLIHACAPTLLPQRPPENYKGPIAEGPILQAEDYWIYRRPDGTRIKAGSGTLPAPVEFPLWIGRMWNYQSGGLPIGQPQTSKAHRVPVEITCEATAFKTISVDAGSFEAFECQCECKLMGGAGIYEPGCGQWTVWYAPQAKNIVKIKTESTASSVELLEYKVSDKALESAEYFNKRGEAYRSKGDYDRAIEDYNEAIRLNPKFAAAFNNRGIAYRSKGDFDRAMADYDQAIRLSPNYVVAFNNRGNVFRSRSDYDRAIQDYNQAIRLNPSYALAFRNRGVTRFYQGQFDAAAPDFAKAAELQPSNAHIALWLYIAEMRAGKNGRAGLENRSQWLELDKWPGPVVDFYLGKIDEKAMYAAAENPNPKTRSEQVCEANFFAADAKLLKKATEAAIPLLRMVEKDCPPNFYQAQAARAELKRLGY